MQRILLRYSAVSNNNDQDIEDRISEILGETTRNNDTTTKGDGLELVNVEDLASMTRETERNRRCTLCCTVLCYTTAILLLILAVVASFVLEEMQQEYLTTLPNIEKYVKSLSNPSDFNDGSSPQSKALQYVLQEHIQEVVQEAEEEKITTIDDHLRERTDIIKQRYVMAVLYYSLNGDDWKRNEGWLSKTSSVCEWHSTHNDEENVVCNDAGLLQILHLNKNNLKGTLPAMELQHLSNQLLILDVDNNYLTGTIPSELGRLTNLQKLLLSNNNFEGAIPAILTKSSLLQLLRLDSNPKLKGAIRCDAREDTIITFDCTEEEESLVTCDCSSSCHCCSEQNPCMM